MAKRHVTDVWIEQKIIFPSQPMFYSNLYSYCHILAFISLHMEFELPQPKIHHEL